MVKVVLIEEGNVQTPRRKRNATFDDETWAELKAVRRELAVSQNRDVTLREVLDRALRRGLSEIRRDVEKAREARMIKQEVRDATTT